MKNKSVIMQIILGLLFPRRCPVCDGAVDVKDHLICSGCRKEFKLVRGPVCMKCGKKLQNAETEHCHDCTLAKHYYERGAAILEYTSAASALYRFKYKGRQEYAEYFGGLLADALLERMNDWKPQALVPVPIHSSKMRKRGYNQAELLAKVMAQKTGIPMSSKIVTRIRKTTPQKGLNEKERQNNLKKAFKICRNDVKLDTIVIIDDIYTTGSTIDAIGYELQRAGVRRVYYMAIAIGQGL